VTFSFPYDLADLHRYAGAHGSGDPAEYAIQLVTQPWAYAHVFPPLPEPMSACAIEFDVWVTEGQLQVAALGPSGRYCFDEAIIGAGRERRRIRLRVPSFEHLEALVFRNAAEGVCRFRFRPVAVTEREPGPDETAELAALESLLASASQLRALAPATSMLGNRAREAARDALGGLLARAGLAVVTLDDPGYSEWLGALSDQQLVDLAGALVVEPNAVKTPGWRFDWACSQADPHLQLRVSIWRAMRDRRPAAEVDLPWLGGTVVRMPLGSDISLPLFTLGQFEPNICRIVRPLLREGDTFIDIGANEGLYTLLAAKAVGEAGLVVAVEPSPRELRRLRRNMARNDVGGRVIILDQAMSSDSGWADFAIAGAAHAGQNAFADRFDHRAELTETRATATMTLDMLADRLAPRTPNFIKIDVEGAEFDILCGADWVVEEARPIWAIEIGRTDASADLRVVKRLERAGYTLFAVDNVIGGAVRPDSVEAWAVVENIIAVPTEQIGDRWPEAFDETPRRTDHRTAGTDLRAIALSPRSAAAR
jgi:FkbM family methyltransferase